MWLAPGSILPTRPVVFLLSKHIPLIISTTSRGFVMRESHTEHVLIQIHMSPLKAHSRSGHWLPCECLACFPANESGICSGFSVWVSLHRSIGFSFKQCPLLPLSFCLSGGSYTPADAAQAWWDLGLLNGKTHVFGFSHRLIFVPVTTYPLEHELMFSSKG